MALAANLWTTVPLFYGHSAQQGRDLEAEEFMERQEALMLTNQPNAGQPEKIQSTVANFRGQARQWWAKNLPTSEDAATITTLETVWVTFRQRFVQEYYPFSKTADANINWVSFTQKSGESVYLFIHRINTAAAQFADLVRDPAIEAAPVQITPHGLTAASDAEVVYLAANPASQLDIKVQFHNIKKAFRDVFMRKYTGCVVAKVALNGLKDPRLRQVLLKCISEDDTIATILTRVRVAESQLSIRNNTQARAGGFNAVNAAEDENEQESAKLNAINAKGKGKNKGKGKPPPKGKPRTSDSSKQCDFCHRPGHAERECFTKKNAIRRERDARDKDSGPTPGVSSTRGDERHKRDRDRSPDINEMASAALNSMLTL